MGVSILTIPILWQFIWRLFYELPRGDDNLYISVSLLVHDECPSVNLLQPEHLPALVDALDTLAW